MRTVSILYLPAEDDRRFGTIQIVRNLAENPPAGDFIIFSDHPQPMAEAAGFKITRLKDTVEQPSLKKATIVRNGRVVHNYAAVNHMCFLTALRIAESQGYSHYLYLEEDVRVKNRVDGAWDEILFREFFEWPRPLISAGTVMCYDVSNHDRASLERFERFAEETKAYGRKLPLAIYGSKGAQDSSGSCIFCNGAAAIYSVAGTKALMPERETESDMKIAAKTLAWDFCFYGIRGWKMFGPDWYELIGVLPSVCSHYGNIQSTLAERMQWLEEGKFVAIHQCKEGGRK